MIRTLSCLALASIVFWGTAAAPVNAAPPERHLTKGTRIDVTAALGNGECEFGNVFLQAVEWMQHQGGNTEHNFIQLWIGRYNVCTGETLIAGFGLATATSFVFDKRTHHWELIGTVPVEDDVSGTWVNVEVSLRGEGTGPVYSFNCLYRAIELEWRGHARQNAWTQSSILLPGSYVREEAGPSYDPATAGITYLTQETEIFMPR